MSLDVYLFGFRGGQPAPFDRSIIVEALGNLLDPWGDGSWGVLGPDGKHYGGVMSFTEEDADLATGFSINRPPFSREFIERLLVIMRQVSGVFLWPDEDVWACVASADTLAELPKDMFDRPEQCAVVSTVDEFAAVLGIEWRDEV